jgi:hypothetical protein
MLINNFLTISNDGKGIPYGGDGTQRPDGDANFGFKNVKGDPAGCALIPELARDHALARLVLAVNDASTGLFSVGCVSGEVADKSGFRWSGYMEFALNSKSLISNASNYFPIFFHFAYGTPDEAESFDAEFHWALMGARFAETNSEGFTCVLTMNTYYRPTKEEALTLWGQALGVLESYLSTVQGDFGDPIYSAQTRTEE